ncbi:MAG: hypothetical protein R6U01_14240 [Halorubrum sp.]|uniref:hypothetical protein n=1 Tax=Halorubrum sp. TaxID=1879286 RepID=UPI0039709ABA
MGSTWQAAWSRLREDGPRSLAIRTAERTAEGGCLRACSPETYWTLASRYYRWRATRDVDGYDVPTDPFRVLWVDPDDIVRHSNREYPPWQGGWRLCGRVADGDWDRPSEEYRHPPSFEDRLEFEAFRAHFVDGVQWGETEFLLRKIETVENGGTSRAGEDREEILDYWTKYDDLYQEISETGYDTQRDRVTSGAETKRFPQAIRDEIAIDIARDGEPLFVDGSHRLSIAKLLDLDSVPTVCFYRHEEWMGVREAVYRATTVDELGETARRRLQADHPDLRDLHDSFEYGGEHPSYR